MTQKRNIQYFEAQLGNVHVAFTCWTTSTRNGFCHTVAATGYDAQRKLWWEGNFFPTDTKVSYYNRTWERFDYETALARAIEKFPKMLREPLRHEIIEKTANRETERCNAFLAAFTAQYENLSDRNKEILAKSPHIQSEEQAQGVLAAMKLMNAVDAISA